MAMMGRVSFLAERTLIGAAAAMLAVVPAHARPATPAPIHSAADGVDYVPVDEQPWHVDAAADNAEDRLADAEGDDWAALSQSGGGAASFTSSSLRVRRLSESASIAARATDPIDLAPGMMAHVPEPATWMLLIMGFAMIGAGLRRRILRSEAAFTERMRRIASGDQD